MGAIQIIFASILLLSLNAMSSTVCPKPVRVAYDDYPPFQVTTNNNSAPSGIDIKMLKLIFNQMGCEVEFVKMPFKRILVSIEEGTIDLTGSALQLESRKSWALFSESYITSKVLLYGKAENIKNLKLNTMDDLLSFKQKYKLGVIRGYGYSDRFEKLESELRVFNILDDSSSEDQLIEKIQMGRTTFGFINELVAKHLFKKRKTELSALPNFLVAEEPYRFMLSKKSISQEFLKSFNQAILKVKGEVIAKELAMNTKSNEPTTR